MSEPTSSCIGAVCAATMSALLAEIFGPAIGLAQLFAALVGVGFYYLFSYDGKGVGNKPLYHISLFVATVCMTLYLSVIVFEGFNRAVDTPLQKTLLTPIAAVTGYLCHAVLVKAGSLIKSLRLPERFAPTRVTRSKETDAFKDQ